MIVALDVQVHISRSHGFLQNQEFEYAAQGCVLGLVP